VQPLFFASCLALLVTSCAAPKTVRRPERVATRALDIRVLLAEGRESVAISAGDGLVVSASGGITLLQSPGKCALRVSAGPSNLELKLEPPGNVATAEEEVTVVSRGTVPLSFENVAYSGDMKIVTGADAKLMLVNTVPLETYLEGVVPHEMGDPGADGFDALKAQAVAARTYALERIETHTADRFDVYAGVRDQVYQGLKGRNNHASAAVRDTHGMVAENGKGLVKAYYCGCCGGHTSDIAQVWPKREPAEYLSGIPDREEGSGGAFCRDNRYFRWRFSFTGKELGDMLRVTLPKTYGVDPSDVGEVLDIRIENWAPSGRVTAVIIRTTKDEFTARGDEIRWVLMADPAKNRILPSIMFNFDKIMEQGRVAFLSIAGGGNGHGVGMCQSGAIAMSKKGYTYQMILKHYYPGCQVVREY
jgi:stage II sporulation protein D